MKIRFLKNTYIRLSPVDLENSPIGIVYKDTILDMEDNTYYGTAIGNINKWYRDSNGWYYWSGESEVLPTSPTASLPASSIPKVTNDTTSPPAGLQEIAQNKKKPHLPGLQEVIPEPEAQRFNWALEKYAIPRNWWQGRQLTGRGISVAILSTGIAPEHPDIAKALTQTFNAADPEAPPHDQHGLGTQAAILVGGQGRIAYGVAPEASLLIGKIGHSDYDITPENLLAGFNWAIEAGAHIIALLVDFREITPVQKENMTQVIARAKERNILLLAPVGNSLERRPENRFPASLGGVLSVGAFDENSHRCVFSAKSHHLDLLAPGEHLLTSDLQRQPVENLKTTALAAAFTAGMLALVREGELNVNHLSSPEDMAKLLHTTAIAPRSITKGTDIEYGYGLLDPQELLKYLQNLANNTDETRILSINQRRD